MEYIKTTAGVVVGDPELYNLVWRIGNGKTEWECTGCNRTMDRARFARLTDDLRKITIYVPMSKPVQSLLTYD